MSSIFELLKKLEPNSPGTGIGLAICRKVVENHFGSITAKSKESRGVTFTILLPLQQNFSPSSAQESNEEYRSPDVAENAQG
jgi:signal transduction histidine kinase